MSTYHVPVEEPRFFGAPSTKPGRRAMKWLGLSVALLVVVVATDVIYEAVVGGGQPHSGFVYDVTSVFLLILLLFLHPLFIND